MNQNYKGLMWEFNFKQNITEKFLQIQQKNLQTKNLM